jgi:recombination protein RecR
MDGVGPGDLNINSLIEKIKKGETEEIIFALSSTLEGDTTNFFIFKQLEPFHIKTTTIARGISIGDELEYADELTLGRSIINRVPFENSLKSY